jgi:hypothetical protein
MQQSLKTQTDSTRYFRVALVETAAVPQGGEGDNWCRYVLESGSAVITIWRRGSLQEVTQHAIRSSEELNDRNNRGTSPWALRRKTWHRVAERA